MNTADADIGKARDHIASDFRSLANHAEELLRATTSMTGDSVKVAREQLNASLRQARAHLDDAHAHAMERARVAVGTAVGYVRERPYQTLAIAVLLGLAVGIASAASRRRD